MSGRGHAAGRLAAAAGLTTWLALLAWSGFVERPTSYLTPAAAGIVLVVLTGWATRRARCPVVVVVAAQLLVVMLYANLLWGSAPWPSSSSIEATVVAFARAVETAQLFASPVPAEAPSVAPLLVGGGLLCHLLVDLAAATFGRVPVAGLPLLMVYSLPVSLLDRSVGWLVFTLTAIGFLGMLVVQESERINRWGRPLDGPAELPGARQTVGVGATATGLALLLPLLIPTLELRLFDGEGPGGSGGREVRISNPLTDLRRDLVRGVDVPLLRVRGAAERPTYLRISALTSFTGAAWTPGGRDLPAEQAATGPFPPPLGLAPDVERVNQEWQLEATEAFDSTWLPTSLYVSGVEAGEDWRYDEDVLDVHAADRDLTTEGMDYELTTVEPRFEANALVEAPPAPFDVVTDFTELPENFPPEIVDLAVDVVRGEPSRYEQAVALQTWFRTRGGFEYNTDVAPGNSGDLLVEFLTDTREGYCEQFASAMAVMARALGIPARVGVGFLEPESIGQGAWEFSAHDLHAWPELYFEDAGWVRFEPTPAARAEEIPPYTAQGAGEDPEPILPSDSSNPQTGGPDPQRPLEEQPLPTDAAGEDGEDRGLAATLLWAGLGVALLAGVALSPRAVRRARTAARWRTAGDDPAEAAWAELRDVVTDCGLRWPTGRSPRATAAVLVRSFAAPVSRATPPRPETGRQHNVEAARALDRLVLAVEQSRYAARPEASSTEELRKLVEQCADALRGGLTRQARWRADWVPASVLTVRGGVVPLPTLTRVRSHQDVVDHVG